MPTKKEELSFEDALERLQTITESMENGDIALTELVAKFEEGSKLLKVCQSQLQKAELKIEKLNLESGELESLELAEEE
ncbi:MAG: exodeoxyribonuclease VII small subunit [Verrucomicrobiota bacterium]